MKDKNKEQKKKARPGSFEQVRKTKQEAAENCFGASAARKYSVVPVVHGVKSSPQRGLSPSPTSQLGENQP